MIHKILTIALLAGLILPAGAEDFNLDPLELKQAVAELKTRSAISPTPLAKVTVPTDAPDTAKPSMTALALECQLDQAQKTCTYSDGSSLPVVSCLQESGWLLCTMDRPSPPVEFQCLAHPRSGSWFWSCAPYGGS